MTTTNAPQPTPSQPQPETYEEYRDRRKLERAERLDKFEADSDSRYRPDAWPYR